MKIKTTFCTQCYLNNKPCYGCPTWTWGDITAGIFIVFILLVLLPVGIHASFILSR